MPIVLLLSVLLISMTVMGWVPYNHWLFRGCDFPRLQVLAFGGLALCAWCVGGLLYDWPLLHFWPLGLCVLLLLACMLYQLWMVLPYTRLWKKQVLWAQNTQPERQIALLVCNVLTTNRQYAQFIQQIQKYKPDIVLTLETDQAWQDALQAIEPDYPYRVAVPLDNLYGMHLYSRLPLIDPEVKFLLSPEIPSIHSQVRLNNGKIIWLYALHPKPPSPTEAADSTLRDAELLMVGRHIEQHEQSCIVAGDLNDVAWSRTTRLFQRISGLLDPRVGRHYLNTFHAQYRFIRWSLDHVFHSTDFSLIKMIRLPNMGSDHFPVLTILHYDALLEQLQPEVEGDADDDQEAVERIEDGLEQAQAEHPTHQRDQM